MNLFALSGLSVGISCMIMSAITLCFGKTRLHRHLLLFNLAAAVWGFGLYIAGNAGSGPEAVSGWKIAHAGGFFIGPLFYHFVCVFTGARRNKLQSFAYLQAAVFILISVGTEYIFNQTRYVYGLHYHVINPYYILGFLIYLFYIVLSYLELARFLRHTRGHQHTQTLYIIFGFMFGFAGATSTFLPMFGIDVIYPFGNFGIPVYACIVTYAILRHRLLDLHLVFRKSLTYSLSAGVLTSIYIILLLVMTEFVSDFTGSHSFVVTVMSALIIAFLFTPLKNRIQIIIDRYFYRTATDHYAVIQNISGELAAAIDLKNIYRLIVETVFAALKLKSTYLLSVRNEYFETACFQAAEDKGHETDDSCAAENFRPSVLCDEGPGKTRWKLKKDSELARHAEACRGSIVKEELPGLITQDRADMIAGELRPFNGEVAVPIYIDSTLRFFLILGEKLSGDFFSHEDINLLNTVANQAAVSLKNAMLYDELEVRVEERTAELSEANVKLKKEIDDRRRAEEELKTFAVKLEESNTALQNFAHIASHDLQEPLRKVTGFGSRLKEKYSGVIGEQGSDYIDRMMNAASRMQTLIDGLLDYSRVTTRARPYAPVNLSELVREVLSDLEVRIEQTGAMIEMDKLPVVNADALQMRQLFQNLIGNALKFHKPGEPPYIKVTGGPSDGDSLHGMSSDREYSRITVEDSGIGFDEQYADRIFGMFQRLHSRSEYEGTGIGLSVCKKIVERHGGAIAAKSAPGQGATFIVELPGPPVS